MQTGAGDASGWREGQLDRIHGATPCVSQGVVRIQCMDRNVITAAELERMSPAEQDRVFEASIVKDLALVPPEFLARIRERVSRRIASDEASQQK